MIQYLPLLYLPPWTLAELAAALVARPTLVGIDWLCFNLWHT